MTAPSSYSMAAPGPMNPDAVIAQVKRLLNVQLKTVLKYCNLPVSGAKAALQQRIISQVNTYASRNDIDGFNRLRHMIFHPEQDPAVSVFSPAPPARSFPSDSRQPQSPYQQQFSPNPARPVMPSPNGPPAPRTPAFKPSPFYTIIQPLTSTLEIKVREQTRDNVQAYITLQDDIITRLVQDPTIRVMIFCAADSMNSPYQGVDIAFPYQIEVRVNQDEVKANLRGLKNKPGSTSPADITDCLRKRAGYENHLQVTYALTTKKFFLVVHLVRQHAVSELVGKLKASNKKISKERVISESKCKCIAALPFANIWIVKSRADDSDIVAMSSILSLKCPLSTLRIEVPCRSTLCNHNQCFDATSFLQLQQQGPTWTCPICSKQVLYGTLQIDQYVDDILRSTPKSLDQVTVEPDGKWLPVSETARSPGLDSGEPDTPDSDDLVEIKDTSQAELVKREANTESVPLTSSPISFREVQPSSTLPLHPPSSNKRSSSQVVDLTLSSDDEDIVRPPKRQVTHRPSSDLLSLPGIEDATGGMNRVAHDTSKAQPYRLNPFPTPNYDSRGYVKPP